MRKAEVQSDRGVDPNRNTVDETVMNVDQKHR